MKIVFSKLYDCTEHETECTQTLMPTRVTSLHVYGSCFTCNRIHILTVKLILNLTLDPFRYMYHPLKGTCKTPTRYFLCTKLTINTGLEQNTKTLTHSQCMFSGYQLQATCMDQLKLYGPDS